MEKQAQRYEGKAKIVYATDDPSLLVVAYKDDLTAGNGAKKGSAAGKGAVNNQMSNLFMQKLEQAGIPTHFVRELSKRETLVKRVQIIPLEVIVRNIAAGSFCARYGAAEGMVFAEPTVEFSYKNDDLGDPLICVPHILALNLASRTEIAQLQNYALRVNDVLRSLLRDCGVTLVDFKLEFGRLPDGEIILADEISPDTCRFWDSETGEKLDKDRFRQDLGGVEDAYEEMLRRLLTAI